MKPKNETSETDFEFPEGIKAYKPHDKAPNFVICDIAIDIEKLREYAGKNETLKFQVLESKKGTYYLKLNDYVKPN